MTAISCRNIFSGQVSVTLAPRESCADGWSGPPQMVAAAILPMKIETRGIEDCLARHLGFLLINVHPERRDRAVRRAKNE